MMRCAFGHMALSLSQRIIVVRHGAARLAANDDDPAINKQVRILLPKGYVAFLSRGREKHPAGIPQTCARL
jgi:hypothetical protein